MNIKKLNISFDPVTGKILFDIDVDGISCRGRVDVPRSIDGPSGTPVPTGEGLTELLYLIEEGCQKIRRKIAEKELKMKSAECEIIDDYTAARSALMRSKNESN